MKQLKPISRCNMCPHATSSGTKKECWPYEESNEISNPKKIAKFCTMPKFKEKMRIPVIEYCWQCKHHERGYCEWDTGYQEWKCHRAKRTHTGWEGNIPDWCPLKDYTEV